jgi:hypothetical protein
MIAEEKSACCCGVGAPPKRASNDEFVLLYQALGVEWAIELESVNGPFPRLMKALTGAACVVAAGVTGAETTAEGAGDTWGAGVVAAAGAVGAEVVCAAVAGGVYVASGKFGGRI